MRRRGLAAWLPCFASRLLAAAVLACSAGCSTLEYYAQALSGHLGLLESARPVSAWLADPQTPPALRERLELSQRMRDYSIEVLKEPDNNSYRRYADLHRSAAVWNVVAAPELSLELHTWCFVWVGCVGYRGYYDESAAAAFGAGLRKQALDVTVYGVPAYSTLGALSERGWFADPLLSTFIGYPEGELAALIFHELAHQIAYAKGDTVFNESFATAVQRLGATAWLQSHASPAAREQYERIESRREDFRTLTLDYRKRFDALYRSGASDAEKRAGKASLLRELRVDYAKLKATRWDGFSGYDAWFASANNASFGVLAAYTELVPAFERLFERSGRDYERFYAEVKRLAALPADERRAALEHQYRPALAPRRFTAPAVALTANAPDPTSLKPSR